MRFTKRALVTVLIIVMAVSVLSISALAANYENCADDLSSLGLLEGTGSGYDLDSAPTRVQAGIMLIRLLGQKEIALSGEYEHPFTDVPEWAEKYVGYLYETGLTKGISDTEFGTDNPCDVGMYTTFMLRALGYDDTKGDFEYTAAVEYGSLIGVVDSYLADGTFLRDNMAAISLLALKTQPKDKSAPTLLDKLVDEGAVAAAAAKPVLDRFAVYDEYITAAYSFNTTTRKHVNMTTDYEINVFGQTVSANETQDLKVSVENNELLMISISQTESFGETEKQELYYKDGYMYINANGEKLRIVADVFEDTEQAMMSLAYLDPFYGIAGIAKDASGLNTVYKISYSDAFISYITTSIVPDMLTNELDWRDEERSIEIKDLVIEVVVDYAGRVVSQKTLMDMNAPITVEDIKTMVEFKCSMVMNVLATGSSVVFNFPSDLNTYIVQAQ